MAVPHLPQKSAAMPLGAIETMRPFKLLEPNRQPVVVRPILVPVRPIDQRSGDSLQSEFEKRAIMNFEQPVGDVNSVLRVDADQGASKATWWILVSGKPWEITGCSRRSFASMTM